VAITSFQIENYCDLEKLAHSVKTQLNLHLTILDEDGDVLIDSHSKKAENQRYAQEIVAADTQNYAYKIRTLSSTGKDMLIVAKKYLINGDVFYIRLSREIEDIRADVLNLNLKVSIVLLLFFIAIFMMTFKIKAEVGEELDRLTIFLTSLTKKKKESYIRSDYSSEFVYVTSLLSKIAQIIIKQEHQRSKNTKKLELANQQKDDIISAISHEFKNPIAIINGYVDTLLEDEDINPNIRRKFLEKIEKNGVKLSELIDTLRLSIKLDSKQESLEKRDTNLYALVEECSQNLELNYKYREIIIEGDRELSVSVDAGLFSVLMSNLIENALKYSEDEVYVKIESDRVSVIDTGIGISKNDLDNITDKFYRINKNSWNNSLGLGLFLVQNITTLHDFKLEVASEENSGSTFSIIF